MPLGLVKRIWVRWLGKRGPPAPRLWPPEGKAATTPGGPRLAVWTISALSREGMPGGPKAAAGTKPPPGSPPVEKLAGITPPPGGGMPGAKGIPGGDRLPPGGMGMAGGAAPGGAGKWLGIMPPPAICTMFSGRLCDIMAAAAMAPKGGADEYGAIMPTFSP